MILFYQILIGLIGSGLIAFFAYISHYLTISGVLALIFLGATTFSTAPAIFWLLLLVFFGSSLLIAGIKKVFHPTVTNNQIIAKGSRRDAWQLLANSLPFLICIFGYVYSQNQLWKILAASALAGATADTWSSEIGMLSKQPPRNIISFKIATTGLSGAVSSLGLAAGFGGSLLISSIFALGISLFAQQAQNLGLLFFVPLLAGFGNTLIDSFLGATIQTKYLCPECGQVTEQKLHHGQVGYRVAGWPFVNNDLVNLLAGLLTIVVAWLMTLYI